MTKKRTTEMMTVTIEKVKFSGKWTEFWFEENIGENEGLSYDLSSKTGYLMDAIDRAKIYGDVMTHGLKGRKLIWAKRGPNWEIHDFALEEFESGHVWSLKDKGGTVYTVDIDLDRDHNELIGRKVVVNGRVVHIREVEPFRPMVPAIHHQHGTKTVGLLTDGQED